MGLKTLAVNNLRQQIPPYWQKRGKEVNSHSGYVQTSDILSLNRHKTALARGQGSKVKLVTEAELLLETLLFYQLRDSADSTLAVSTSTFLSPLPCWRQEFSQDGKVPHEYFKQKPDCHPFGSYFGVRGKAETTVQLKESQFLTLLWYLMIKSSLYTYKPDSLLGDLPKKLQ